MSKNINFITANELPIAEGEQVEVLCLEGAELKRKPADGLGGGSGITIHYTITDLPQEERMVYSVSPVPVGTFARVKASLMGEDYCPIEVAVRVIRNDGGNIVGATQGSATAMVHWEPLPDGFPVDDAVAIAFDFEGVHNIALLPDDRIMTSEQMEEEFGG